MFKKVVKYFLYYVNLYTPIFAKDSFYEYDFETGQIKLLKHLYSRKYEMQYYCDFDENCIYTRYSKYLKEKVYGLLVFCNNKKRKDLILEKEFKNLRIYNGKLYTMFDENLYCIDDKKIVKSDVKIKEDFDFIAFCGKDYFLNGLDLYTIENDFKFNFLKTISFNKTSITRNNFSFCFFDDAIYLVCREGEKEAYETKIVLYKSKDLMSYIFEKILVDSKEYKNIGIDGVGFPVIRDINGKLKLIFVGYWGKHLLRRKTVGDWRNI